MIATPTFGEVAPELELRGFESVPTVPSDKRPAPDGWQTPRPAVAYLPRYAGCGVGLLTRRTPAADTDVRRLEAAEAVDRLAAGRLGDGPLRFGQAPKRLRVYRTDAPFTKVASREFVMPGDDPAVPGYKPHRVEVLADGQQFVCYGIHPGTGRPYAWPDASPLDLERRDLPPIDAAAAARFVAEAEELLVRRFHARPQEQKRARARTAASGWRPGPSPRAAADPAEAWFVLEALANLPNDDLDYDTWIAVGYALKAALGEAGWRPFEAWSRQNTRKYDAATTEAAWRYARPGRAGWRFLIGLAGGDAAASARAAAALRRSIDRVAGAPRNRAGRTLYLEARDLGPLVAAAHLPAELAFMGLATAAERAGVPAAEAVAALRGGLLAGEARHG